MSVVCATTFDIKRTDLTETFLNFCSTNIEKLQGPSTLNKGQFLDYTFVLKKLPLSFLSNTRSSTSLGVGTGFLNIQIFNSNCRKGKRKRVIKRKHMPCKCV